MPTKKKNTTLSKIVAEAKRIQKAHPHMKWTNAIKDASKHIKEGAKTVVAKTKTAKKTAKKSVQHMKKSFQIGSTRSTGFSIGTIVKKFTIGELKKLNPIYFEKGNDKFFGVSKRKLVVSTKLNSQIMIEKQINSYSTGERYTQYSVRKISSMGEIGTPKICEDLFELYSYIGKKVSF